VRDQIKEVEELKAEHDEIYNQITGIEGIFLVIYLVFNSHIIFTNTVLSILSMFQEGEYC
jgi:hypothetical protein